jgi:hypothetical protein
MAFNNLTVCCKHKIPYMSGSCLDSSRNSFELRTEMEIRLFIDPFHTIPYLLCPLSGVPDEKPSSHRLFYILPIYWYI